MPKRGLFCILAAFAGLLLSCGGEKGRFTLEGTVQNGSTDSIIVTGLDMNFARTDTIRPKDGKFTWSFMPDTATTLILLLADGRQQPVFADKDQHVWMAIPDSCADVEIGGNADNEAFQRFFASALDDSCMEQTFARIDSFIQNDPFSNVTPYLIYEYGVKRHHAGSDRLDALIGKMSGNMQDAPFLTSLKSEFRIDNPASKYLNTLVIHDTANVSRDLSKVEDARNSLLLCVWASWDDSASLEARKRMEPMLKRFKDRKLEVADLSVDLNPDSWRNAIKADTLSWKSYHDRKGLDSGILTQASIKKIPCYVLLSSIRSIQYVTGLPDEMEHALDSLLAKPEKTKTRLHDLKR